jgi:glyoxylase-like metal-dependent hydrolase (beta-lactamase superfamily II)
MNDNPTVIRTGGKIVLVDTGMGAAAAVQPGATAGFLMRHLAAIGIGSGDVDIVIVSHFHGDHVNGLVAPGGGPAFPEAEITVPANEWSFWMDDGERTRASRGRMQDLFSPSLAAPTSTPSETRTALCRSRASPGLRQRMGSTLRSKGRRDSGRGRGSRGGGRAPRCRTTR